MDLIGQYSSSFSEDDNDDEHQKRIKRHKKDKDCNNFLNLSKSKHASETTFTKVVHLAAPDECRDIFRRTKPHIKGNWSGHIYIRLDGSNEDSYAYRNEETYDRLKDHVMNIIHSFKNRIETTIRGEVEGIPMAGGEPEIIAKRDSTEKKKILDKDIVIVPHLKLRDPGCCSSSEDESDSNSESENEGEVNDDKNDESGLRPLHISLSRPFYMQHQSIEPFISDMRERVRIQQQHPLSFSISARVSKCEILTNDEKTRSFLTVPLTSDKHAGSGSTAMIQKLVTIVDGTLLKFGHKGYYPDPKFHISIASWAYDERLVDMSLRLNELPPDNDDDDDNDKVHDFSFCISGIHCIFGNAEEHHIPFGC